MVVAKSPGNRQRRVQELKQVIRGRFSDARFEVTPHPDARGVTAIWTYTSADPEEVADLVREREVEIMVDDGVHLLVIPMPPAHPKDND